MSDKQRFRAFDEMLNECHPEIKIGTFTFSPADVLANNDPIGYDVASSEYFDGQQKDNALLCFACDYPIGTEEELGFEIYPHDGEPIHGKRIDCQPEGEIA
jgi:hypothetical protein